MNNDFFVGKENAGFELLEDLNQILKIDNLTRTPKFCFCDASGTTKGKTIIVEIKLRNAILITSGESLSVSSSTFQEETIMIESHKLASMAMSALYYGTEPLYVNFLQDGTAIVFNLKKLSAIPEKKLVKQIISKGYERKESTDRFFLNIKDGWIYRKENGKWKVVK